uniref:Erythronate-4-phosphate dehydrogenase family protein n=1 Tax=Kalanchoe fedtschenkoi TaxID=63787 RepID=A0A7N0SZT0_KALFE
MENLNGSVNKDCRNGRRTNSHPAQVTLPWLDLRVFYVRVSQCVIDDSTPEFLTLNHMPINRDTLLEVKGVRANTCSNPVSALLRRDRLDKRSEEATFVSTDVIKMTGSTKFEVVVEGVAVLSGVIDLCRTNGNGAIKEPQGHRHGWSMRCESDLVPGNCFLKGSRSCGSPTIDVYVTGTFLGNPIILTNTFQLSSSRNQSRNGSMPEYNMNESRRHHGTSLDPIPQETEDSEHKDENEEYTGNNMHLFPDYPEGDLSWFNAGVRVGVGIGLSVCLGIGIGLGLLVRTYQGTASNFRRQLF